VKGRESMDRTLAETKYGKLKGIEEGGVCAWKGVPYAKPPVGSLRFREAQPPESWQGVRDASKFGPNCAQTPNLSRKACWGTSEFSEDCLYLNIWSPGADDRRRPVMVWIHGGFFRQGMGSYSYFNGASFAEQGDLLLVTINYRVGPLGFFQLADIGGEEYAASGNNGLLDQVAALKWIQDNIAAFGGDPQRVTIFGQSAGGRSVGALLATPKARGLFSQAIIHSGGIQTYADRKTAGKLANEMLASLHVQPDELAKLVDIPVEKIVEATPPPRAGNGMEPNVDGVFLPQRPLEAVEAGWAKDIRIMVGHTLNDFIHNFDPNWERMNDEEILQDFADRVGDAWPEISEYYLNQGENGRTLVEKLLPLLIYNEFTYPALKLLELQDNHGSPAWFYRFDWKNPMNGYATHGLELPFVFNNLNAPGVDTMVGESSERQALADQMHQAWIAFAHNGVPNTTSIPNWPSYRAENRAVMLFDLESKVEIDMNREERLVWEKAKNSPIC
jgi:para-nitrobenzyl esterase